MASKPKADPSNPILNSPYEEPAWHYATDQSGNLNYDDVREKRRVFTTDTPVIPLASNSRECSISMSLRKTTKSI